MQENVDAHGLITLRIDNLGGFWPGIGRLPAAMKFSA
jgi:hypothetical protein